MTTDESQRRVRRFGKIIQDLSPPLSGEVEEPLTDVEDSLLWCYATGCLSDLEEASALCLLASRPAAGERLAKMRQALAATGLLGPIEAAVAAQTAPVEGVGAVAARALAHAASVLAGMGRELSSVAAVILKSGEGLVLAMENAVAGPSRPVLQPLLLGETSAPGQPAAQAQPRIDVVSQDGRPVVVIRRPDGQLDLDIEIPGPALQGEVRLIQLTPADGHAVETETHISGRLRNNRALLEDCPEGILKIIAPDGWHTVLCVEGG